jgi:hypothetical protein
VHAWLRRRFSGFTVPNPFALQRRTHHAAFHGPGFSVAATRILFAIWFRHRYEWCQRKRAGVIPLRNG